MVGKWRPLMGGRLVDVSPLRRPHEIFFGLWRDGCDLARCQLVREEPRAIILCNDGPLSSLDGLYQAHNSF